MENNEVYLELNSVRFSHVFATAVPVLKEVGYVLVPGLIKG